MSVPRRLRPSPEERAAITRTRLTPGALAGRTQYAAPVVDSQRLQSLIRAAGSPSSASQIQFQHDSWTLTAAGTQTETLTYLPIAGSEHIYLNGIEQLEGTDWSRTDNALSALAAMDCRSGDVLEARYAYLVGTPGVVTTAAPGTVVTPFGSSGWKYLSVAYTDTTDRSAPGFDDSTWATGTGGFGGGSDTVTPEYIPTTNAFPSNSVFWLRRTLPAANSYSFRMRVDNSVVLYLDGVMVTSATGKNTGTAADAGPVPSPDGATYPTGAVLAARAVDDGFLTYIDIEVTST